MGRVAVVTGVGRTAGIGFAIARRLLDDGYRVLAHSHERDDAVLDALGGPSGHLRAIAADLGDPGSAHQVIYAALEAFGAVDALVVNHAHASDQSLASVTV